DVSMLRVRVLSLRGRHSVGEADGRLQHLRRAAVGVGVADNPLWSGADWSLACSLEFNVVRDAKPTGIVQSRSAESWHQAITGCGTSSGLCRLTTVRTAAALAQ